MDFYMKRNNVEQYKEILVDYDNTWIMGKLAEHVCARKKILELGMGTGIDLNTMLEQYDVLGTDNSPLFIDDYKKAFPERNVALVDATNINLNDSFDCVYSNKVLHHLTREEFKTSLTEQFKVLNDNGIVFMTLWYGSYEEQQIFGGEMLFTLYSEDDIKELTQSMYNIVEFVRYSEIDEDDSMLVVLKKNSKEKV